MTAFTNYKITEAQGGNTDPPALTPPLSRRGLLQGLLANVYAPSADLAPLTAELAAMIGTRAVRKRLDYTFSRRFVVPHAGLNESSQPVGPNSATYSLPT